MDASSDSQRGADRSSAAPCMKAGPFMLPMFWPIQNLNLGEAARIGSVRTMLGVPLLREGTPIGVIVLQRNSVRPFTDKQIELVDDLRRPGGDRDRERAAVRRGAGSARDELSEAWSSRPRPQRCCSVISSSPGELEPVFEAMLENATRICEAKFGTLSPFRRRSASVAAAIGTPNATCVDRSKRSAGRFVRIRNAARPRRSTKQAVHIADMDDRSR